MTKPPTERFNRDRAARILVDAITLGDKTAATRHDVCEKTIQRHRARLLVDPQLSAKVQALGREAEHGWHFARAQFLRKTLAKLEKMVEDATVDHFEHVIEALKAAGELDLATEALGVGSRDRQQGPAAPEATVGSNAEAEVRVTRTAADHLARYVDDFLGFTALLDIVPKQGPKTKLRPNAIQSAFEVTRTGRDIVLKPRQVGLTTWELARDIWFFLTKPGARVVIVCQSDKDDTALKENSDKVQRMLASLVDVGIPIQFRLSSATQWVLAGSDSSLKIIGAGASKAAASKKGRSGTIHRLHVTEAAFFEHAATTMNALLECVPGPETGSEVVVESTANGAAGWFFERYLVAKDARGQYKPHFFSWLEQSEYRVALEPGEEITAANDNDREVELVERHGVTPEQLKWYRLKVIDKGDPDLVDQEFPTDEETCWITPGRTFFQKKQTRKLLAKSVEPRVEEDVGIDGATGKLRIWSHPLENTSYVIAVDPSEGLKGETEANSGDPGAAVVYRRDTGEHVATLHGYFPTWEMARLIAELGKRFNWALLIVERNNHGHAVLQALDREQHYPASQIFNDDDGRPGWNNGQISRATALESLESAHRKEEWTSPDRVSLQEFLLFIVIRRKAQAGPGAHDDLVLAHAIAHDVLTKVNVIEYDTQYDEYLPAMRV